MLINYIDVKENDKEEINLFLNVLKNELQLEELDYEVNIASMDYKEIFHNLHMNSKWEGNYSYRAVTLPYLKKIYVFINEGETYESLKWVIIHELTHANLRENSFLRQILTINFKRSLELNNVRSKEEYEKLLKNDSFHEGLLEEKICNEFATILIGANYDRTWWRNQLLEVA